MAITAKKTFDFAYKRAEHFLTLYNILHNNRQRKARSDWMGKLKDLMHWPAKESIVRIDGKDNNSLLLLRESLGIDQQHFSHDYTSELLRSSIVAVISALNRYMHDIIIEKSITILSWKEDDIPSKLKKIKIPILATKKAVKKIKSNPNARPGHIIKSELQKILHDNFTFQKPESILNGASMLGIKDLWSKIAQKMPEPHSNADVMDKLKVVANRRNEIVHEADIILKTSANQISQREIAYSFAEDSVVWIGKFVSALDEVITEEFN